MTHEKKDPTAPGPGGDPISGLSGMLTGVVQIMEQLKGLAEKGEELKKVTGQDSSGTKEVKTDFGYSVQFGGQSFSGGRGFKSSIPRSEPFKKDGSTTSRKGRDLDQTREPHLDAFQEDNMYMLVVEMPGVSEEEITFQLTDRVLEIRGQRRDLLYLKNVELPERVLIETMEHVSNNGIVEIRFQLAKG